jgi:hypothetical protein
VVDFYRRSLEHGSRPIARTATGRGTDALSYEDETVRQEEGSVR